MSDIKQIRLNDTDYDIRDARIYSGALEANQQLRFKTDGMAVLFKLQTANYGFCYFGNERCASDFDLAAMYLVTGYENGEYYFYCTSARQQPAFILINAYDIYITDYEE